MREPDGDLKGGGVRGWAPHAQPGPQNRITMRDVERDVIFALPQRLAKRSLPCCGGGDCSARGGAPKCRRCRRRRRGAHSSSLLKRSLAPAPSVHLPASALGARQAFGHNWRRGSARRCDRRSARARQLWPRTPGIPAKTEAIITAGTRLTCRRHRTRRRCRGIARRTRR